MGWFGRRSKKNAVQREEAPQPEGSARPARHDAAPATTAIPRLSAMGAPIWAGRALTLPRPLDTDSASTLAQDFADSVDVTEAPGDDLAPLDFTVGSIRTIDAILGQLEPIGTDDPAESIVVAGLYVGETLVRGLGYRWIGAAGDSAIGATLGVVVQSPRGELIDPIGRAFSRVENGDAADVSTFVAEVFAADRA
nr:hypothetical protein [uncultured Microbacterium sp.]